MLVEALPRSSALLRSAAALLAHHTLGALLRLRLIQALIGLYSGSFKALLRLYSGLC